MVNPTITTSTRTHATSAEVEADIQRVTIAMNRGEGLCLQDSSALAIAAQWQSPGIQGRAFAQLASTGSVPLQDLSLDIVEELCRNKDTDIDVLDLLLLLFWANHHSSLEQD